ncbi:MYB-related protein [Hordeum vulgare]|uniref:Predicted protein n=1 Tax=Hordeum vulgare subsp. vulgare TaxID=112509 RepID=F2CY32_HORVV|nr:uncharacterized protein LOC123399420 [Hordeum vulgare subsp. vulgare]KAE8785006.1 MYB-related protein [Hordeum vulgare]BAJ87753.1 predicted protein [Hordeum vulgare subsp. vulgare]
MAGGSDGPDVSAGGEIWGTLEELVLAFAVCRHGTASWDSVATEVQARSPLAARPGLTPGSCRLRFRQLHRRFSAGGRAEDEEEEGEVGPEAEAEASAVDGWLDELRRLRVAELRREVERCDLSIGTLQSKVELMKEERERSLSSGEAKPEGVTGDENLSSEEPGQSCRESNSTDLKRPGAAKAEEAAKEELSGESKESAVSLQCRRRKASAEEESDEPLAALLDRVAARFGPVFDQLQESQESESYRGTIRRHVDLEAMRRKLDGAAAAGYASSAELYRDLLLLCANAAVYLPRHAPDHAAAALNALRLVSAQVSASLREPPTTQPPAKREPPNGGNPPPAPAGVDSRRAEADIVGPLIQKAAKPLIFCRKRSSIAKAAAAAAVARKEEATEKRDVEEGVGSDGEKKAAVAAAAKGKAWGTGTKKTRGPGKNSALSRKAAAAAAEEAAAVADKKDNGDSDGPPAGGLPKKRVVVDFLKRLNEGKPSTPKKRGSPLTKRKRAAPAPEEEEEQPKARRGPGRKNTGRGGSKAGAKAATTKKSVGRPQKRGAAPATPPPPSKRAKVNRSERSSSSSRRGGRK